MSRYLTVFEKFWSDFDSFSFEAESYDFFSKSEVFTPCTYSNDVFDSLTMMSVTV